MTSASAVRAIAAAVLDPIGLCCAFLDSWREALQGGLVALFEGGGLNASQAAVGVVVWVVCAFPLMASLLSSASPL